MGRFDEFYEAKDYIIDFIKTETVGPVSEEEVLESKPLDTYVSGILWAKPIQNLQGQEADEECDYERNSIITDGQVFDEGSETGVPDDIEIENISDGTITKSTVRKPSTMGISVMLNEKVTHIRLTFSFGKYVHSEEEKAYGNEDKTRKYYLYTRHGYSFTLDFDFSKNDVICMPCISDDLKTLTEMGISIRATKRLGKVGKKRLVTFSVSNDNFAQSKDIVLNENALFQCMLKLYAVDGAFSPLDPGYSSTFDLEDEILSMQYKDVLTYAQGHGCATSWKCTDVVCREISSDFVPVYEVRQMKPPSVENEKLFSLKYLFSNDKEKIVSELGEFIDLYHKWLLGQQKLSQQDEYRAYKRAIDHCLEKIEICEKRIREGIRILSCDNNAWKAFVYTNKAMY